MDGNVERVVSRLLMMPRQYGAGAAGDEATRFTWAVARSLVEGAGDRPGDLNQSLMELGKSEWDWGG